MDIFDSVISSACSYASSVIKIDIVKPMPAKNPIPKTCFHFKPRGNAQIPAETATKLKSKIPNGLPIINPAKIPMLSGSANPDAQAFPNTIAVFANAKIGRITSATGLCSQCCKTIRRRIVLHLFRKEWQMQAKFLQVLHARRIAA